MYKELSVTFLRGFLLNYCPLLVVIKVRQIHIQTKELPFKVSLGP